jgi:DNA ligase-1
MKRFARLYEELDRTTSTNAKVGAIAAYLRDAPPADAAWALYFLTGRRLKRHLPTRLMHAWTMELTGLPEWLVHESYGAVGDFAETIALLLDRRIDPRSLANLPPPVPDGRLPFDDPPVPSDETLGQGSRRPDADVEDTSLATWIEERILPLRDMRDAEKRMHVVAWWARLPRNEVFLLNKLLTGEFRVGVSHTLVVRAIAHRAALPTAAIEHRLMGSWEPSAESFAALVAPEDPSGDPSRPYPFCLASPLEDPIETLGSRAEWLVEWKWDGIRAQLIHRAGHVFLWSRGEELITTRFPEIAAAAGALPAGTVLDGELLAFDGGAPRPFADLQRRIGRERRVHEVAVDVPVVFLAYDVLEDGGVDIREWPLRERRKRLLDLQAGLHDPGLGTRDSGLGAARFTDPGSRIPDPDFRTDRAGAIRVSEELTESTWDLLAGRRTESRARGVEGLMLKRWTSVYRPGRRRGDWWKWKIAPHTIDAVLIYAQPGSGRRATLFTDYTFGVWDQDSLVPVAKAYSGLTDQEIDELDRWVRRHTIERFGPVSAVEPVHVFELGFERIAPSTRHKSGVAVRFPRMLRWRRDKRASEADTLDTLRRLIDDSVPPSR